MCESQTYTINEVSEKLITIFQNVNDWLKFAEAKNGILLAFSGTGFTAILTVLGSNEGLPEFLQIGLLFTALFLSFCTFVCSLSFLPTTNLERFLNLKKTINPLKDNFYYFGHLRKYKKEELLIELDKHYLNNQFKHYLNNQLIGSAPNYPKEWLDIAQQIIINAQITWIKFKLFTSALHFLLLAILAIPLSMLARLIIYIYQSL